MHTTSPRQCRSPLATVLLAVLASALLARADEPATPDEPARGEAAAGRPAELKLPGLRIDFRRRLVDVDATVCLRDGALELVACGKGTKEHESIVAIETRPLHVHAALLALGAEPRTAPAALLQPLAPGDPVAVSLVVPDPAGGTLERTIAAFVTPARGDGAGPTGPGEPPVFPETFVFVGSQQHDGEAGRQVYAADETGSVVSVVTFGDEVLGLAGEHSTDNDDLLWEVDATHLPQVGAKVLLRLRPRARREVRHIRGWEVRIDARLLRDAVPETARALALLDAQLADIERVVPAQAVDRLRQVPLYFHPEYPGEQPRAEYHSDAAWLLEHGRDPVMEQAVEFTNVATFAAECRRMPNLVLHELAHAYHHRWLPAGFEHAAIRGAWEQAQAAGLYDRVERRFGDARPATFERAYAATNPQEYFAEATEAFFGRNDFFPFTAADLRRHDPAMFALLAGLWGRDAVPAAAPAAGGDSRPTD